MFVLHTAIFETHQKVVEWILSNFRASLVNSYGVPILRVNMVTVVFLFKKKKKVPFLELNVRPSHYENSVPVTLTTIWFDLTYRNNPYYWDRKAFANSVDPAQMP